METIMAERTIRGHLAADPTTQQAGRASVTRFRVLENTGSFRGGSWVDDKEPTAHAVEAWFELGDTAATTLRKGDGVIVVGKERTESWDTVEGGTHYGARPPRRPLRHHPEDAALRAGGGLTVRSPSRRSVRPTLSGMRPPEPGGTRA